jgi:hypothetical protein
VVRAFVANDPEQFRELVDIPEDGDATGLMTTRRRLVSERQRRSHPNMIGLLPRRAAESWGTMHPWRN